MESIVYSGKERFEITGFKMEPDVEDGRIFLRLTFANDGTEWIGFTPNHAVTIGDQLRKRGLQQIRKSQIAPV